jgi:hypothetical protein
MARVFLYESGEQKNIFYIIFKMEMEDKTYRIKFEVAITN